MSSYLKWLESKIDDLPLTIVENSWTNYFWPGLTDVTVLLKQESKDLIYGRGLSFDADNALTKATAELLERVALTSTNFKSSNGFAAGENILQAEQNALRELIERDLLLNHIACHEKLSQFPMLDVAIPESLEKFLKSMNISISCFAGANTNFGQLIVARADGRKSTKRKFGFVLGFGLKEDPQQGVQTAILECIRDLMYILDQPSNRSINLKEFLSKRNYEFTDHMWLNSNIDFADSIEELFSEHTLVEQRFIVYDKNEFEFQVLNRELVSIGADHLPVVRAFSSSIHSLRAGCLSQSHLSPRSIVRFGRNLKSDRLNYPHFIS